MKRPTSVSMLLLLVYIGAAFTLIIAIEQFIAAAVIGAHEGEAAIRTALDDAGASTSYAGMAQTTVFALACVSLAAAIAHVVLALLIARRHNWARWVLIVLVAIGTVTDITWVLGGRWFSGLMLTVYDIAILVLALMPATAAYCRGRPVADAASE